MRQLLLVIVTLIGFALEARGQSGRILPVDDPAYVLVSRLQQRGYLLSLNPTSLPYIHGELAAALARIDASKLTPTERKWYDRLVRRFGTDPISRRYAGIALTPGLAVSSSKRLDALRPLEDEIHVYPFAALDAFAGRGPFTANVRLRHDLYYDRDPDGIDVARRLMVRSEDAYLGYRRMPVSVYLGRFQNHWGSYGDQALVVSANPRSYDQIHLRIGGERLAVTGLLGELDSIDSSGVFGGSAFGPGSKRRFLAAHRIDWRPSPYLSFSLVESALYSGENSSPSLKFLNPLHVFLFVGDNKPKNDENNIMLAGMMWAYHKGFTLYGQFLLDDYSQRGTYPHRFALTGSLTYSGLSDNVTLGFSGTVVGSETYNTFQPEGRYVYLNRGIGTQFSDYVLATGYVDLYLDSVASGFSLRPYVNLFLQGERDMRLPIASRGQAKSVLSGVVERTLRSALVFRLQPDTWWWVEADAGVNATSNADHVRGNSANRFAFTLSFGLRIETVMSI